MLLSPTAGCRGTLRDRGAELTRLASAHLRCWRSSGLVTCSVLACSWCSGVQHDEGDTDGDGGGGQQGVPADLLAEQPPSQDDGDERADERKGAGELA